MKTIKEDIDKGQFKNAYLLCGEEEYLKLNFKNQLIAAVAGDNTMNLALYEGKSFDVNEVIDNAETFPFFANYPTLVNKAGPGTFCKSISLMISSAKYIQRV